MSSKKMISDEKIAEEEDVLKEEKIGNWVRKECE